MKEVTHEMNVNDINEVESDLELLGVTCVEDLL
jgi:hypothetical protein